MKKLLLSLVISFSFLFHSFGQDILVLKNGDEIKVKVSEILPDLVKYKKWDNQSGPVYSEAKANVFMIKYPNGTKDVFSSKEPSTENSNAGIKRFLGDWRCNIPSGKMISVGDEVNIRNQGASVTVELIHNKKSVQNTGVFENDRIKVSFPVLGETIVTYSEILGKPSIYVFGASMEKSLKSSTSSAYTGLLSIDSSQAIVSVIFRSVEDEISSHEDLLTNKLIDLLKSNKRMKSIHSSGADTSKISLRYQLEYTLITFYSSKPSTYRPGTTAYTAQVRIELALLKLDNAGHWVRGIRATNQLVQKKESLLSDGYVTKQGAFEALLPEFDNAFYQQLYSFFPVTGAITAITEASRKGEPKKVRISAGTNEGVMKEYKFRIVDSTHKKDEYDLVAVQVFDDYSICDVKHNETSIAESYRTNNKIFVTNDLNPQRNNNIEDVNRKTAADMKIAHVMEGSWYGNVTQKGVKKPYSIQLAFNFKMAQFKVSYPTLGCTGFLTIENYTDTTIDFREHISPGQNSCSSEGLISIKMNSDDELAVDFSPPHSKRVISQGTLKRE